MGSLDDIVNNARAEGADEFDLDFSDAISFDPLPDGPYVFLVKDLKGGESKEGNAKVVWQFEVVEGEFSKRILFAHVPTSGKASGRSRDILRALGLPADDTKLKLRRSDVLNKMLVGHVRRQKDNDAFNEVSRYEPYVAPSPLS